MSERRLRRVLVLCGLMVLANASAACANTLRLAPGAANSGNCQAAACGSFSYAYGQAQSGDVIEVGPGVYGEEVVPEGDKTVTFAGAPGAVVRTLNNHASNVTFDRIDVDAGGAKPDTAAFENHGEPYGLNVTFRNGRIGNVVDQKGALLGGRTSTAPMNVVFDNVEFHDVMYSGNGDVHQECVFSQTPGLVIRNSSFRNCSTMDISLNRGDWWGQPPYGNVTLENNVFGHSTNGGGWHHYGLAWFVGEFDNVRVVNNTFENAVLISPEHIGSPPHSGVWANNIGGGWECVPGVTYRNNVGTRCDGSDRALSPSSSCAPPACGDTRTVPVGWVDPASFDFRLRAGSSAIDFGSADFAPATDHDGHGRRGRPDAGAYEFGVGGAAGPGPGGGPGGGPGPGGNAGALRIRSAKLRPRVICKRSRARCRSRARLIVELSRPARLTAQVRRLRAGRKPLRVRRLARPAARRRVVMRIRARGLRRGRHRVVVVARADSARTNARVLKLRVRR